MNDNSQNPPKTSSSSKSGHSHVHLPGHNHRHNKSNDDARSLRPSVSREDSGVNGRQKDRTPASLGTALGNSSHSSLVQRPSSPTPSRLSNWSQATSRTAMRDSDAAWPSNGHDQGKRHLLGLGRFLKGKDKGDKASSRLKELPSSVRSFHSPNLKSDIGKGHSSPEYGHWSKDGSPTNSDIATLKTDNGQSSRPSVPNSRQGAFKGFSKRKGRAKTQDDFEPSPGSQEKNDQRNGSMFSLDTNLSNMEGILAKPPALTPLDNYIFAGNVEDEAKIEAQSAGGCE